MSRWFAAMDHPVDVGQVQVAGARAQGIHGGAGAPGEERSRRGKRPQQRVRRTVAEGEERLSRTWPGLVATGLIAGIDVGFGVFTC